MDEYFSRLEETSVKYTEEEAKKEFLKQSGYLGDWFCDCPSGHNTIYENENTYLYFGDKAVAILTLRETEA